MLVLSRRCRQSILIAGRIKVTVLTISGNHVEIGVEAPLHISVDREEVHARKQGHAVPAGKSEPPSGGRLAQERGRQADVAAGQKPRRRSAPLSLAGRAPREV